ncbi:MAG: S1/P1 nuclease [Gammaproteobacteria bacterium]|nr:S1/P1 nuclease [Gammaproteobacteria bacterium]
MHHRIILAVCLLLSTTAYPWNAQGHQLIAQIALMQLNDNEIKQLNQYNQAYQVGYQPHSLSQAAVWLDWLHCKVEWCKNYRYYHYIDYPYSIDGTPGLPPRHENALLAIRRAQAVLQSKTSSMADKGLQLRVLMHVIGDIHQPLHTVSLYSRQFPKGDQGGNRFVLGKNRVAPQLHAYWDRGGGSLTRHFNFKKRVARILKRYPCNQGLASLDPAAWTKESNLIARETAYDITPQQSPSHVYHRKVVSISEQQIALAGCRLGHLLVQDLGV